MEVAYSPLGIVVHRVALSSKMSYRTFIASFPRGAQTLFNTGAHTNALLAYSRTLT